MIAASTEMPTTDLPYERRPSADGRERRRLSSLLVFGALLGIADIALIAPSIPRGSEVDYFLAAPAHLCVTCLPVGLTVAFAIFRLTRDPTRWLPLLLGMPIVALACALYATSVLGLEHLLFDADEARRALERTQLIAMGVYTTWLVLVYGTGAAVLHMLQRRIDFATDSFHHAVVARERNAAALADARVRALVERIEPGLLLDVMTAARERYRLSPDEAEAIVDDCVVFLRSAIPQLRSGTSTVDAEVGLAVAYLSLRERVDARPRRWRVERAVDGVRAIDQAHLPMPPMALIPLLDMLLRACEGRRDDDAIVIRVAVDQEELALSVGVPGSVDNEAAVDPAWFNAMQTRVAWFGGRAAPQSTTPDGHSALGVRIVFPLHRSFDSAVRPTPDRSVS